MNLDIVFDGNKMNTPVYVKLDALEQLLLAEGVRRQLNNIQYHPLVSEEKSRKTRGDCAAGYSQDHGDRWKLEDCGYPDNGRS